MNMFKQTPGIGNALYGLLLGLTSSSLHAEDWIDDSGLWSQIEGIIKLETLDPKFDRFRLWFTGEARFFNDFDRFSQGIVRFVPGYQFSDNIALFFGYTWQPTVLTNGNTIHEHDINQAMTWSQATDWGSLSTRTMIEWRFVTHDSHMATRLRQRVRTHYQLADINPHLSLIAWEELFLNVYSVDWGPESGFDQNRVFAGLGWQFDQRGHYTFEVGYMNQYLSRPGQNNLMNHMLLSSLQIKY